MSNAARGAGSEVSADAVRQQLERILSSQPFRNKEKLAHFLRYVVDTTLAGSPEKLKQYTIGVDALGYAPGEDCDGAVRAHARRLRQALDEYNANWGAGDAILIELPKGGYVPRFQARVATSARSEGTRSLRLGAVTLFVITLAIAAYVVGHSRPNLDPHLHQITYWEGDISGPAPSRDGRMLAYSADEHGESGKDLWVMPMNGDRTRRQLTRHAADDYDPDISPDGRWIVFRSMRDSGGVYLMPAQGGEARRLSGGFRPKFAPNGQQIAYSLIQESGNAGVWIQSLDGATRRISTGLAVAGCPVWSPDSRRVLVRGALRREDAGVRADWWVLTLDGSEPPQPTGAGNILPSIASGTFVTGCPADWAGNRLLVADGEALWEVTLDDSLRARGEARLLHRAIGIADPRYAPSANSPTRVIFAIRRTRVDIWGLSRENQKGGSSRVRHRWTNDETIAWETARTSLSRDGSKLVYLSQNTGKWGVWLKEVQSGYEWLVASGAKRYSHPLINAAGNKVAYFSKDEQQSSIRITDLTTKGTRIVCENCGELLDWSMDETRMLAKEGQHLVAIHVVTGGRETLLDSADYEPQEAAYSPDRKWIALVTGVRGKPELQGVLFRSSGGTPRDWIRVTAEPYDLAMHWSPEGNILYYFARRENYRCLWGQLLDGATQRPKGSPFAVEHFHGKSRVWGLGWTALSRDWFAVNVTRGEGKLFYLRR